MSATFDPSKITDGEIALIIAKRDVLQYEIEVIDQLLNKIGEVKGFVDATKPPHQTTNESNQAMSDFDKLPWRSYATKNAAQLDENAWVFGSTKGAEVLLEKLKANDGKVKLGAFEYSISGPEKQFISRNLVKQESSTA
jgi:uncharacterized protein YpmS